MTHRFKYLGTQEDHQGHRDFGVLQYASSVTGEIRAVPFYRSTGKNSGSPGAWFPFHGVNNSHEPMEIHVDGSGKPVLFRQHKGWFIKPQAGMGDRYDHDHGPRYGHGKLANLAEWMDENIGDYQFNRSESVDDPSAINGALHDANAWGMHPNAHAGPPPPPPPPDTVQTGEPMNLAWQLLKEKKPDPRLKAAGVSGYNKPKRTPNHPKKSHVVVARSGGKVKTIRFGEQGADTVTEDNPKGKRAKKRASFKARHRKNIKRGPMSAAYWADKVKW